MVSLLAAAISVASYWDERTQAIANAKQQARSETVRAAQEVDRQLRQLSETANDIATDLSTGRLNDKALGDRVRQEMRQNSHIFSIVASYVPYGFDPQKRLYAPMYARKNGAIVRQQVEESYDYTNSDWYRFPLEQGSSWIEPYFGEASETMLVEYGTTFYRQTSNGRRQTPQGIISANYSVEDVRELMLSLEIGQGGYGFILSKTGQFAYHPVQELVAQEATIFDWARRQNSEVLAEVGKRAISGQKGVLESDETIAGEPCWIFYEPISSVGWSLGTVLFKSEIFANLESLRHKQIAIALSLIVLGCFISILAFRIDKGQRWRLWAVSGTTSVLLAGGIGFIWYLALNRDAIQIRQSDSLILTNRGSLQRFLQSREAQLQGDSTRPAYIPTGLFLQSLEFTDANDVFVTGYVWQKYTDGIHEDLSRGVIFPEAVNTNMTEAYRYRQGEVETIGWYFETELRQPFDYSKYPFDVKDPWIRMWHEDFSENIILVPDLEAYDTISPTLRPGIEKDFVLQGQELVKSYFSYRLNSYNTNFGIQSYLNQQTDPELYFTLLLQRDFVTIFISYVMRLLVVSVLLFAVIFIATHHTDRKKSLGFSASGAISSSGAFIFILLLDQINLRSSIATAGIIYIESFYFVLYVVILLVAINALLIASKFKLPLLRYQDNLIPKLLYWPTLLFLSLIVTLLTFL
jgi:hypothetical protein